MQSRYYNPEWSRFINGDGYLGIVALATYVAIGYGLSYYNNHNISYSSNSSGSSSKNTGQNSSKSQSNSKPKNSGRSKNKLRPDPRADGPHSTFKRDSKTGKITNYETWKPNIKNSTTGFDSVKRYDGTGKPHYNPVTEEYLMPHVHDKTVPGKVRAPLSWEIPN